MWDCSHRLTSQILNIRCANSSIRFGHTSQTGHVNLTRKQSTVHTSRCLHSSMSMTELISLLPFEQRQDLRWTASDVVNSFCGGNDFLCIGSMRPSS